MYYTLYQNIITNIVGVEIDSSKSINEYYNIFKSSFYNNSINNIKTIYTFLNNIFASTNINNYYSTKICNLSLAIIKNFYR